MRLVIQRVSQAKLNIAETTFSEIGPGLVVLVGIEDEDSIDDVTWCLRKLVNMRIFSDENGKMNASLLDIGGEILLVSQFTLHASTKKGNRPSFIRAAKPEVAQPLYEKMIMECRKTIPEQYVKTGQFGAHMAIELTNDGPVTIFIDSKNKE